MKSLWLLTFATMVTAATLATAEAQAPATTEYDRIPEGILLTPAQREAHKAGKTLDLAVTDTGVPAVDPQVPTHSLGALGDIQPTPAPSPRLQTLQQIEQAYAEGRHADVLLPLEQLVAQDDTQAMLMLGVMLDTGQGTEPSPERAAALMTRAAEAGVPLAQHRLAIMYYQGRGMAKDNLRALMWLNIAIAKYPPGAERNRAISDRTNLDTAMSRRDRETAQFMAKEWLQKRGEAHLMDAAP